MANAAFTIGLKADPNDFDVSVKAIEQALTERRERLRARRPKVAPTKQQVILRLDQDVLAKFRGTGPG